MSLKLKTIFQYGKCTADSRNFCEGEEVLQAKHVILCGTVADGKEDSSLAIYALVLQTSALSSQPHTVTGSISKDATEIKRFLCTCKAGASECCKHILAVLLHCNRNNISSMERISSTDQKCLWSTLKGEALKKYKKAEPVTTFCCYKPPRISPNFQTEAVHSDEIYKRFLQYLPDSALAKHTKGKLDVTEEIADEDDVIEEFLDEPMSPKLLEIRSVCLNAEKSMYMDKLSNSPVEDPLSCCRNFYYENVMTLSSFGICRDTSNDKDSWQKQRQFRITASKCYNIYTYKGENWDAKVKSVFFPRHFTNKFVAHGLNYEKVAIERYCKVQDVSVLQCGLIVSETNPWLGYSPDGIIFENNIPAKLIEIKCPWEGKTKNIKEVLSTLSYMKREDGQFSLKKQHQYYGQINLGMAVLNIKQCDFIIFCSKDNSMFIETINSDDNFIYKMLPVLKDKYVSKILHKLCQC